MLEQGGAGAGGLGVGGGMLCEADLMTAPVDAEGDGADYDAVFM